jgi:hypothetical protein
VVELLLIKFVSKESKDYHIALTVVAQNGKANVARTIISSKSEVWKRRMDKKQNSLHVAARAERLM